jgi:predicted ATPase
MKIKFWNLGSIKEAELDLRPLTVIIGPNNSNKTYIAYSIYGLWKHIASNIIKTLELSQLEIEDTAQQGLRIKVDSSFIDFFSTSVKLISQQFDGFKLEAFFQDSSHKIFERTGLQLEVSDNEILDAICILQRQEIIKVAFRKNGYQVKLENNYFVVEAMQNNIENEDLIKEISASLITIVCVLILREIFSIAFPFPGERNALINTYKFIKNTRYRFFKGERFFKRVQRGSGDFINIDVDNDLESTKFRQLDLFGQQENLFYPQPVEDFLDFLTEIELENKPVPDSSSKNKFQELADQIEEHIQNNNKTKFKKTKFGGREIKVSVKRGLEIDLYNASSSIKQLAPLLLYLRYRAKAGDFLVIDEPEMNLHPESQVKLLEALAILVNLGVRVLLTTHSPYLMAHLNNIVNANHQDQDILEAQAQSLYLQDSQAFLKMEQVSAYEMKNNQLISLHDPDYGIRWDTLSDVSVDVQQKFFAIYEAGQKNKDTEA